MGGCDDMIKRLYMELIENLFMITILFWNDSHDTCTLSFDMQPYQQVYQSMFAEKNGLKVKFSILAM